MKNPKTIPTILAVILLVVGIVAGVFLVQSDKIFQTSASPDITPQQVRITNISDKSITISWITDRATEGFVSYGSSKSLGTVANQQANIPNATTVVHHTIINNVNPATIYYFKIGSADKLFDNNGQLYQVKTAPQLSNTTQPDIILGGVVDSGNRPVSEAIVYINILGVTPQSVVTDISGKWSLPLSTARSTSLNSYASYSTESILEVFAQAGAGRVSTAKVKIKDAHPVPPITLGQNLDFTNVKSLPAGTLPSSQITLPSTTSTSTSEQSGFSVEPATQTQAKINISVTTPTNNEAVNTTKPEIAGTGTPKTVLTIKIDSINGNATVDTKGNWSWTVSQKLDIGKHTLTVSWNDENNQTKTITRLFTVLAAGSSSLPAFSASSSGSPLDSTSTASVSSPKPTPTPTPVSSRVGLPGTSSGELTPGGLTPSIAIFIMGMLLIITGIFFPKIKV